MPAVIAPLLGFVLGVAFAWLGAEELGKSGEAKAPILTVVAAFALMVYAPMAAYFLAFAPDWSYAYVLDSRRLPGAADFVWVLLDVASVPAGFASAARHARLRRTGPLVRLSAVPSALAFGLVLLFLPRLSVHASYTEFHGDFGTKPVSGSPLGFALLAMALILLVAVATTTLWLRRQSRGVRGD